MAPQTDVLILSEISGLEDALRKHVGEAARFTTHGLDVDEEVLAAAEVIIADPPSFAGLADKCTSLKWLQSTFAGVDALVKRSSKRDYACTRLSGVFGPRMAEYTVLHVLAQERALLRDHARQQLRQWGTASGVAQGSYRSLGGLVLGVLGMGDIGSHIARVAGALGMTVWGLRQREQAVPGVERMFKPAQLPDFLSGCDYIVNVAPSTGATAGMLSGEVLSSCAGRRPVLINIGRGDVVDEASVVRALDEGWLGAAVLDVFPVEPLPQESPLWRHPKVTITPHSAAESTSDDVGEVFKLNLERYRAGTPLAHALDWGEGY